MVNVQKLFSNFEMIEYSELYKKDFFVVNGGYFKIWIEPLQIWREQFYKLLTFFINFMVR